MFISVYCLDGKSYDACVMYYESNACAGLSEHDAKTLENTLEEQFGYSLCLFHRNVLPGRGKEIDCLVFFIPFLIATR